jgi:hypothetical protein
MEGGHLSRERKKKNKEEKKEEIHLAVAKIKSRFTSIHYQKITLHQL